MPYWRTLTTMLRSLLAITLAVVAVVLVNQAGGWLAEALEFPTGGDSRLAWDLGWVIASGTAAIWVTARVAPCAPRGHALVSFVLLLAAVVWAVFEIGADFPWWFCAGLVLALPLEGWLGVKLALRGRSDNRKPA